MIIEYNSMVPFAEFVIRKTTVSKVHPKAWLVGEVHPKACLVGEVHPEAWLLVEVGMASYLGVICTISIHWLLLLLETGLISSC